MENGGSYIRKTVLQRSWVLAGGKGGHQPPGVHLSGALAECQRHIPISQLGRLEVTQSMFGVLGEGDANNAFHCPIILEDELGKRWTVQYVGMFDRHNRLRRYLGEGWQNFVSAWELQEGACPTPSMHSNDCMRGADS